MELIKGYLDMLDRGIFKDKWEARYLRFYDDGILEIYEDEGHFTEKVEGRPKLHDRGNPDLLICIPKDPKREENEIVWLLASTMDQLNDWMKAFVMTFPQGRDFKDKREEALDAKDEDRDIRRSGDRYQERD